jgi:hypothetical protein
MVIKVESLFFIEKDKKEGSPRWKYIYYIKDWWHDVLEDRVYTSLHVVPVRK